jgi:hypothetical protein
MMVNGEPLIGATPFVLAVVLGRWWLSLEASRRQRRRGRS